MSPPLPVSTGNPVFVKKEPERKIEKERDRYQEFYAELDQIEKRIFAMYSQLCPQCNKVRIGYSWEHYGSYYRSGLQFPCCENDRQRARCGNCEIESCYYCKKKLKISDMHRYKDCSGAKGFFGTYTKLANELNNKIDQYDAILGYNAFQSMKKELPTLS